MIEGHIHPVLAHAQREAPVVEADQVLHIEAGLLQLARFVVLVIEHRAASANGTRVGIDRWQTGARVVIDPRLAPLVVEAGDQGVAECAGIEEKLQLVVDGPGVQRFVGPGVVAHQLIGTRGHIAVLIHLPRVHGGVQVLEVLPR